MRDVDVLIPTLRRPEQLTRALRSVMAQDRAAELIAAIVVVDNSPEGSARAVVDALRPASPAPLVYAHEPRPGVATARNAGLQAGASPLVAFLDDDEEAPPGWLGALRTAHLQLGAAVTFGPVQGVAPAAPPALRRYLDRFFSREGAAETGYSPIVYGCGNSIMTRADALAGPAPFDARSDLTGGEDDRLFSRLRLQGLRFGWAADAWVNEYAPPHRARLGYALKRAFCYGQSPSQTSRLERDWPALARNMTIGAGQATVYGLISLALTLAGRRTKAVEFLDRAVRGCGKVGWFLKLELYGLAATPQQPSTAAGRPARIGATA